MWSHYADSHRGLCIEYEIDPNAHPYFGPVQYTVEHQATQLEEILRDSNSAVRKYYFDKSAPWRYEREWRLLTIKGGTLGVDLFNISALILGARMPDIDGLAIASVAMSRELPFFRAKVGEDSKAVILNKLDSSAFATECARSAGVAA